MNKYWKEFTENESVIYKALVKSALIQFWVSRYRSNWDPSYGKNKLQIYRCTRFNMKDGWGNGTVTLTPMHGIGPCFIEDTASVSPGQGQVQRHWKVRIGGIKNSVFPGSNTSYTKHNGSCPFPDHKGQVKLFNEPADFPKDGRNEKHYREFTNNPLTAPEDYTKIRGTDTAFPVCLSFNLRPKVYLEINYRLYTFKSEYLTKLTQDGSGNYGGTRYVEDNTLGINEIEEKIKDLLRWRCGCKNKAYDIDTLMSWVCPNLTFPRSKAYRRHFVNVETPYLPETRLDRG